MLGRIDQDLCEQPLPAFTGMTLDTQRSPAVRREGAQNTTAERWGRGEANIARVISYAGMAITVHVQPAG